MKNNIHIFYHIFVINNWEDIFDYQLNCIINTKLYEAANLFYVGINYKFDSDLKKFKEKLKKIEKIKILFSRKYEDLPIKMKNINIDIEMGEGETILKMIEFVKDNQINDNDNILFIHSKGVTNPNSIIRNQINYFIKKNSSVKPNKRELNKILLKKMMKDTVENWKNIVNSTDFNFYFYNVWNFFFIKCDFLKKFDEESYTKYSEYGSHFKYKDRHHTAIFPVNLYESVFKTKIKNKKQIINQFK